MFWSIGYRKLLNDRTTSTLTSSPQFSLTDAQDIVLSALYAWRDEQARLHDESVDFIMSNSELVRIGLRCPRDAQDIEVECFNSACALCF